MLVMGTLDRSHPGQVSLEKGLSFQLSFFHLQGNSCIMMDLTGRIFILL